MLFKWSNKFNFSVDIPQYNFKEIAKEIFTPYEYFKMFFKDEIFELIVTNTNLFSSQNFENPITTNVDEIRNYIGIELLMSIVSMPAYTDFWSTNLRYEPIASVMPLKRYKLLRRQLHFVDNLTIDQSDRYAKIRPILEHVKQNFLSVEQGKRFSIDEMMIPYKGTKAGTRRQYIRNKPKKWGFKMFVRAGVDGFVYDLFPYGGENTFHRTTFTNYENRFFGLGQKVVIEFSKSIPDKSLSVLYFDNWFTSLELVSYLRKKFGILSLGTIQQNRLRGCNIIPDKQLLKKGRGNYSTKSDNKKKISVVKWADNKCVTLVSSFVPTTETREIVQRYDKSVKSRIDVSCPKVIKEYNTYMGGVDLADMLVSLCRTGIKSHRWYIAIFSQLLDICVNNAWILYRRHHTQLIGSEKKYMPLKDFKYSIAKTLLTQLKIGRPKNTLIVSKRIQKPTPKPMINTRLDNFDHFPQHVKKGRCVLCSKGQTVISCIKCEKRLCINNTRNCFYTYHKEK